MINFFEEIKAKIIKELHPQRILLIDNSNLHSKHKSFNSKKFYIKLMIKSEKLKKMNKIDAHKTIFSILKNEMKTQIHALEIKIE